MYTKNERYDFILGYIKQYKSASIIDGTFHIEYHERFPLYKKDKNKVPQAIKDMRALRGMGKLKSRRMYGYDQYVINLQPSFWDIDIPVKRRSKRYSKETISVIEEIFDIIQTLDPPFNRLTLNTALINKYPTILKK